MTNRNLAKMGFYGASRTVQYLSPDEVESVANGAKQGYNGERDAMLVNLLFQTGLRISEDLALCPKDISVYEGKPVLHVIGKGKKHRIVACPDMLDDKLRSYD